MYFRDRMCSWFRRVAGVPGKMFAERKRKESRVSARRAGGYFVISACILAFSLLYAPPAGEGPADIAAPAGASVRRAALPGEAFSLRAYLPSELVYFESLGVWMPHVGVDIACAECAALAGGTVSSVSRDRIWGVCVEVESPVETYIYRSLSDAYVSVGQSVRAGDAIGASGFAPCEAELPAHAHIERYIAGERVAPLSP